MNAKNNDSVSAQRAAALDAALAQIDKQFGKGAAMRLGDAPKTTIDAIPTSSLALDIALGIGGLPRGRVIEIYGPESSGKCLTADTLVPTNWGLLTVEEIFAQCDNPVSTTTRVTDIAHLGLEVVNEFGELEHVSALTHNGRKPTLRITTAAGRQITVTHNHPVRVMNERGSIVWRRAGALTEGDHLLGITGGNPDAKDRLEIDEAILLGYLIGDGHVSRPNRVLFSQKDTQTMNEFKTLVTRVYPDAKFNTYDYRPNDVHVNSKQFRNYLTDLGLEHLTAPEKVIPWSVRASGATVQRAFLSALFECDGGIESGNVCLSTSSEKLAVQVQAMLMSLGITSTRTPKHVKAYPDNTYWTIRCVGNGSSKFLDEIGFRSDRRAEQTVAVPDAVTVSPYENIPYQTDIVRDLRDAVGGDRAFANLTDDLFRTKANGEPLVKLSPERLSRIIDWATTRGYKSHPLVQHLTHVLERHATYEQIVSIEDGGEQPTFDLVVPGTHSFVANGLAVHNTTLTLHAAANVQKEGGTVAFIDAEHALDPIYAANLGVDIDNLIVSQPDTGEQALEIADVLIRSGAVDLVVVDSVAALVPRSEIEGDMGSSHVGLQARLMSQALRKITGGLNQTGTTIIFINQLREKIGVMFGCFQYDTRVTLADGSTEKIGKIVNQRMDVEVLSYNPETGKTEGRRVKNWFKNGNAEEFLQFTVAKSAGNGRTQFAATSNHSISTPDGWEEAGDLKIGDRVLATTTVCLSESQMDIIKGSLLGDGSLASSRSGGAAKFRLGHGIKQIDYMNWKVSLLANIPHTKWERADGKAVFAEFTPLEELANLRKQVYVNGKRDFSKKYLRSLSPLAWAIWFMDDGSLAIRSEGRQERTKNLSGRITFSVDSMTRASHRNIVHVLAEQYGITGTIATVSGKARLTFDRANTDKFLNFVYQHVHPSMDYKVLPMHRGCFVDKEVPQIEPYETVRPAEILDIKVKPRTRSMQKFDLEVEGNHNYVVDGALVHNSPETTTGGKALKFYASVRLDIRRIQTIKDGDVAVANRTRVKVVKNKVAPPFRQAEFDIIYGTGISYEGDLIDLGVEYGIVSKSGSWYTYEGDQLGQGKEKVRSFLMDNPGLAEEIERKIRVAAGLIDADPEDGDAGDDTESGYLADDASADGIVGES